jgi:hypothetical protein
VSDISCNADGNRLNLGNFDDIGLDCNNWNFDDNANDNLGVFALMMENAMKKQNIPHDRGVFSCDRLALRPF